MSIRKTYSKEIIPSPSAIRLWENWASPGILRCAEHMRSRKRRYRQTDSLMPLGFLVSNAAEVSATLSPGNNVPRNSGFLLRRPTKIKIFSQFMTIRGLTDLSKGCWNPERKLGTTTHFSKLFKLHFVLYFRDF